MPSLNAEIIYSLKNIPLIYRMFKEASLDMEERDIIFKKEKFKTLYHLINQKLILDTNNGVVLTTQFYQDLIEDKNIDKNILKDCLHDFFDKKPHTFISVAKVLFTGDYEHILYEKNESSLIEKMLLSKRDSLMTDFNQVNWDKIYHDCPDIIFAIGSEKLLREAVKAKPEFLSEKYQGKEDLLTFNINYLDYIENKYNEGYSKNKLNSDYEKLLSYEEGNYSVDSLIKETRSKIIFLCAEKRMGYALKENAIATILKSESFNTKNIMNLSQRFTKEIITSHKLLDSLLFDLEHTEKENSLIVTCSSQKNNTFSALHKLIKIIRNNDYQIENSEQYFYKILQKTYVGVIKSNSNYEVRSFETCLSVDDFNSNFELLMSQKGVNKENIYAEFSHKLIDLYKCFIEELKLKERGETFIYEGISVNPNSRKELQHIYVKTLIRSVEKMSEKETIKLLGREKISLDMIINELSSEEGVKDIHGLLKIVSLITKYQPDSNFAIVTSFIDNKFSQKKIEAFTSIPLKELKETLSDIESKYPGLYRLLTCYEDRKPRGSLIRNKETNIIMDKLVLHSSLENNEMHKNDLKISRL